MEISGNNIDDADGDGIDVDFYVNGTYAGTGSTVEISGNTVNEVDEDGIDADFIYGTDVTVTIEELIGLIVIWGGYSLCVRYPAVAEGNIDLRRERPGSSERS